MSRMSDLDAELRAAGIDPERVDLETAEAILMAYRRKQAEAYRADETYDLTAYGDLHKSVQRIV